MRKYLFILFISYSHFSVAQLFNDNDKLALVKRTVDYIYNVEEDSALLYIDSVELQLPNHPVVPMLRGMKILWENIPLVTVDSIFRKFKYEMNEVTRLSGRMDGQRQEHPEAIFFEMAARGLLAEYYADDDQYMKAVNEASKTYHLLKMGFDLQNEVPEFLFTSGLYNYFREKYPEKYPVYRSFVWLFRSGDIEKGLEQLQKACEVTVISRVEATVYLAYIYLRYEYKPLKAQKYLANLQKQYPNNLYINAKLLESYADGRNFEKVSLTTIDRLLASDRPYYQLAGKTFQGLYQEIILKDHEAALKLYKEAISAGSSILGHGEYYRSLTYLGMGRIYQAKGDYRNAEYHLKKSLENSPTQVIEEEVESLLDQI
ncbi:MAG: tetratricopeptide repeat protein [Cyclobacteriaceae bacterium]